MTNRVALRTGIAAVALVALVGGVVAADDVTAERLLNSNSEADAGNWLSVHRSYDSNRYSPLKEITAENVGGLKLAFAVPLGGTEPSSFGVGGMEATPLAKDGFLYITDPWGTPYKIDVSSGKAGKIVWMCDTGIDKDASSPLLLASRGLALSGSNVIAVLNDGRVIACDDETGDVVWDQQIASEPGEGFSNAPLAVKDKILVGQSFGDWATRGWIAALDAKTGDEVWRFYTVPEPGEPGSETWKCEEAGNPDCWKTGGAAAWVTGSYDPDSNTVFWGTGNPVPMYDPEYRPGDNLYSNSSIALDFDTGKLKWYHQYTPGDYMDYDEVGVQLLMNTKVNGEDRKVLAHFGRNGMFYTLDRTNGSFINATQYVDKLTWTKGIDPKTGLPVEYDPSKSLQVYANGAPRRDGATAEACPNIQGGVNFFPTAYDPTTGIAYGAGIEGCSDVSTKTVAPEDVHPGGIFSGGAAAANGVQTGSVFAFDVATGKQVAKINTPFPNYAGVLLTPGLVWTGQLDGTFAAYDSKSLEEKYSINLGTAFEAPAIAYTVNGKQYIAVAGGAVGIASFGHPELESKQAANMLYVFSL
ncbi:pyrroloquinoline quinone-dependent dehydrogenase [Paradevosia shaoguanensis]|uniref:pyrroloquinoline quinone-dependent dehydrogenase n=1 Tax=Paradevosia shaoguanensis TaxID=1335043 RepID=UPI001931DF04|nr:PQQ-binding-like beta-propeller repeat protein [Paradevosia shaoguanensis]